MDLREHRHAPALDAFDHVQLPQRARTVELPGEDARHLRGKLRVAPGRGERHLADVELDVEALVVDPVGVIEPERDLREAPAERRQQMQALGDRRAHPLGVEHAARCAPRIVDREAAHMAVVASVLDCQELRVEARQLSHALLLSRAPGSPAMARQPSVVPRQWRGWLARRGLAAADDALEAPHQRLHERGGEAVQQVHRHHVAPRHGDDQPVTLDRAQHSLGDLVR